MIWARRRMTSSSKLRSKADDKGVLDSIMVREIWYWSGTTFSQLRTWIAGRRRFDWGY